MNIFKDFNYRNVFSGIIASLLAIVGPPALMLQAASNGNFTISQIIMWFISVHVFGGILGILLSLYYRIPVVGAHTLTGIAFLATVTAQFTYHELIGAYIMSGLIMLLIGYLGVFSKLMACIPKQVIAAMLAGMITNYMVDFAISITYLPLIGALSFVSYLLCSKWVKRIPPMVAAIVTGLILLLLTEPLNSGGMTSSFIIPHVQIPEFNLIGFLSISIPLALVILSNDAAVGIGALEQNDYNPPVNRIIFLSGIFTIMASFFGGQSANVAGMMSAICSDEEAGPRDKRYIASFISGIIVLIFGLLSWKLVPFIQTLPKQFVSMFLGFVLLSVFGNSLNNSFSDSGLKISTAVTFIIAISNITIYNVSAPVWALLIGALIARFIENQRPK
jgi:benzoate membrane transport protein